MNTDILVGVGGTVAAIVVGVWPKLAKYLRVPSLPAPKPAAVSYQEAMLSLATVRSRLVATGGVAEDAGAAIEVITHALVEGSDK